MQILFCENLNSTKLRMKHLGGKWLYGLCWVATQVHVYGSWSMYTCEWPPRNRGIWRTPSDDCFQCSHCHMGSGLINYVAWTLSGLTSRCRGMLGGTGQAMWEGKCFWKISSHSLLSLSQMVCKGYLGLNGYNGESAQPLQSVKLST